MAKRKPVAVYVVPENGHYVIKVCCPPAKLASFVSASAAMANAREQASHYGVKMGATEEVRRSAVREREGASARS